MDDTEKIVKFEHIPVLAAPIVLFLFQTMPPVSKEITGYIQSEIQELDSELYALQHAIWENPELAYTEKFAHDTLTSYMEKQQGWTITKHAFELDTAFLCVFTNRSEDNDTVISINSEFDALPNIGHACGHNLIAVCGITAAIATAKAMIKFDIPGTVKLIGTPAEEGGGGKIKLLKASAYKDVDVSLMAHPSNTPPTAFGFTNANQRFKLEYFGKEAHAAASPWEGINALDAMTLMYNGISVLRQQLLSTDIVQCHIVDGGQAPNIITGHSSAVFAVRAPTLGRLKALENKVLACAKAGALATGCKYKVTYMTNYYNMVCNDVMAECFSGYISNVFGQEMPPLEEDRRIGVISASTDQGNVSWAVPSIQPMFYVESPNGGPHTRAFAQSVSTESAHKSALQTGMCLGFTAVELLQSKEKLDEVKNVWEQDMEYQKKQLTEASITVENLSELIYID